MISQLFFFDNRFWLVFLEVMRLDVHRRNAVISDYVVFLFALMRVVCDSCRFDTRPTDRHFFSLDAVYTVRTIRVTFEVC